MPPLRLAVIECDSPTYPNFLANYGNLTQLFSVLFAKALPLVSAPVPDPLVLTRHHIVYPREAAARLPDDAPPCAETTYPDLDAVDAILVSGSKHDAWADKPWVLELTEFVRRAVEGGKVRVIGVCFGHQIIARALGVQVRIAPGEREAAVDDFVLTDEGKQVFGLDKIRIQQMHIDDIATLPPGATLLGWSAKCAIQAYYKPGRYIAVQGHPEMTTDVMSEFLTVRHGEGKFSTEFYEDAIARAGLEHDGVQIAKTFLEFAMQ